MILIGLPKLVLPFLREDRRAGVFNLAVLLNLALVYFRGCQIKDEKQLRVGFYKLSQKLIPISRIPSHQRHHLGKEHPAGDLFGGSFAGRRAPSKRISFILHAWPYREFLLIRIYQDLHIFITGEFFQACGVYIHLVIVEAEGWLIDMGEEFASDDLVTFKVKVNFLCICKISNIRRFFLHFQRISVHFLKRIFRLR